MTAPKPRAYWADFENIRRAIVEFIAQEGAPATMPTETELRKAGHKSLVVAIHRHHGSLHDVARRLDLSMTQKPKGYWRDFGNVKREILAFAGEHGTPGSMPTATQLRRAGRASLAAAISEHFGGFHEVAQNLGLRSRRRPKGFWRDFDNVERAVLAIATNGDGLRVMPTERELRDAGLASFSTAIYQYHGSFHQVAQRLQLSMKRKPKHSYQRIDDGHTDSS